MSPRASASARTRRLQLVTGKGGVGKTTLCAALALVWAERGRRPLVVELGHRPSLPALLGSDVEVGWDPVQLAPGVHATNIEAERAVLEVVTGWVRWRAVAERALRTDVLRAFLGAAPAVTEVAAMERIRVLLEEGWDPLIVDCDATGHALMFLGLPEVFADLGAGGPLARLLAGVSSLFADPERAALHLVTLPAALPIEETVELDAALRARGHVAMGELFVNRMPTAPRTAAALADTLADAAQEAGVQDAAAALRLVAKQSRVASVCEARVRELELRLARPARTLPSLRAASLPTRDELRRLGSAALAEDPS